MFTEIVEETGKVLGIKPGTKSATIIIEGNVIFEGMKPGDSIAVDGVCLTVAGFSGKTFTADVMPETMNRSAIGDLKAGSKVNLERAMAADGRFGGHIVTGHIDGTGEIAEIKKDDNAILFTIKAPAQIMKYIGGKGSIAIDGISLTVTFLTESSFGVSLIPHTLKSTALYEKKAGDVVNLENDIIGKYVEKLLGYGQADESKSAITMDFLTKYGYTGG